MTTEIWKPIPNYPLYEASNFGNIRSWVLQGSNKETRMVEPHLMTTTFDKGCKYMRVLITNEKGRKVALVHRVILETFVGPCPPGKESCHYDGDRTNNHIENLRWDTRKNNFVDRERHGHTMKGERHHFTKFANKDIVDIRLRARMGETHKSIAKSYDVTRQTISYIVRRDTWKHID